MLLNLLGRTHRSKRRNGKKFMATGGMPPEALSLSLDTIM